MQTNFKLPPVRLNPNGELRRVGFEIEFSGLTLEKIDHLLLELFDGELTKKEKYKHIISTSYGEFEAILDFQFLTKREIFNWFLQNGFEDRDFYEFLEDVESFIADVSSIVVPYEITTPPILIEELDIVETIKEKLKQNGAKGTGSSLFYAFGLHINPEVYSFETGEIVDILRAYFLLEELIEEILDPDLTRKLTPYIDPFDEGYKKLITDPNYKPTQSEFITTYITHNPTRNRSLDLLPLFTYLDEELVRSFLPKEKIGKRPTFHFRLPNSKVDEEGWYIYNSWNSWVLIERLAFNKEVLQELLKEYQRYLNSLLSPTGKKRYRQKVLECLIRL